MNKRNIVDENACLPRKNAEKRNLRCRFLESFPVFSPSILGKTLADDPRGGELVESARGRSEFFRRNMT